MSPAYGWVAVGLVAAVTMAIGALGLRFSRTTSDFYVASRSVGPAWNASAIGGEYLSAASFLGAAGMILTFGTQMLWFPVGWTVGYLFLLVLVAAPLRRSGAYTIPDFAETRLESRRARRVATFFVVLIGWLYLLPQFHGAGLTLATVTGAPRWVGEVMVGAVVASSVMFGGMRSITFVQAFQYWLKLTALLVPIIFCLLSWRDAGAPAPDRPLSVPLVQPDEQALYRTYSLMIATFLGTMGLPHVLVRYYTNPDGGAARRTTLIVLGLLGMFYLLPGIYGFLGRVYAADLALEGRSDALVLELPGRILGGAGGDLLGALVAAGAFAAFLSTSSGLTVSVAGVINQDLLGRLTAPVAGFRIASFVAVLVPLSLALLTQRLPVAISVSLAFAVAASTFCPLLVLGIWWRRLTDTGAIAGVCAGGVASGIAVVATMLDSDRPGWLGALLSQPAAWTVPIGFAVMIAGSLLTAGRIPPDISRTMVRLHAPEGVAVDRDSWQPPGS